MKPFWVLVALVWVPFVSIFAFAAPPVAEAVGDSYPHMAFHVFASVLLVAATVRAWRLHRQARARLERSLLTVLLVSVPLAVAGNVAELGVAVARFVSDGWESTRTPDLFESGSGLHAVASNLTIPALMASMLLVLALVTAAGVRGRRLEPVG